MRCFRAAQQQQQKSANFAIDEHSPARNVTADVNDQARIKRTPHLGKIAQESKTVTSLTQQRARALQCLVGQRALSSSVDRSADATN
jgi:hypothetical protein